MVRSWVIASLVVLAMAARASAGWIEDRPDGKTVIHVVVYSLPDATQTDSYNRSEVAGVNAFKKQFAATFADRYRRKYEADPQRYGKHNWANVSIELHAFVGITVEAIETDTMAIAGGVPPDVLYVNFRKSDHYIQNDFLYPLDRPEDGYLVSMTKDELDFRVHPKIWPVIRRTDSHGQKHTWALPQGGPLGTALLFRKDLFEARGVPYPTSDWTWDDLLAACRKITDPGKGVYGLIGGQGQTEAWFWFNYLWAAGGEVMKQDESGAWQCVFDSREAAASLDFYTRLKTEKWADSAGKERRGYVMRELFSVDAWRRGEVAMYLDYIDGNLLTSINPDLTGMVPTPMGPTGQRGSELNSRMMGLSSQTTEPAVRDAAWEYIRFYDSEEAARVKTRVLVEGGLGPFVNPAHLRRFGYGEIEKLAPKGWAEVFQTAIETGRPEPYGTNASYVYQIATYPVREVEELAMANALPADREARLDVIQKILRRGVARANEEMLGRISPAERAKRDRTAWGVLLTFGGLFGFGLYRIGRSFTSRNYLTEPTRKPGWRKHQWAYVLIAPALLTVLFWQYLPLLNGSVMAFQDYRLQGNSTWVGVQNFGDLLYDNYWWRSVFNALRYSVLIMCLTFLPPVMLAILLQEVPAGSLLFRIVFYLPAVLSGLVTVVLWKQFYDSSENGVLNALVMRVPVIVYLLLGLLLLAIGVLFARRLWFHGSRGAAIGCVVAGLTAAGACLDWSLPIIDAVGAGAVRSLLATPPEPFRWLSDPETAMLSCVIPMVWAGVGPGCLIYLAALKGISDDFYEAADLDGAGLADKILFVVFPILRPLILINFIGVFIGSWYGAEANILAMTGGGGNTEVAGLHIFYKAFQGLKFGSATAMAWVLAFMLIGFTVYQLRIISRLEFRTTGEKR